MTEALGRAITGLGPAAAPIMGAIVRAKFVPDPTSGVLPIPVLFSFSPKELTVDRKAAVARNSTTPPRTSGATTSTSDGASGAQWKKTEPMKLAFTAYFEGELAKPQCDLLLSWMNPVGDPIAGLGSASSGQRPKLPRLLFQWGPPLLGFVVLCTMASCKITYKRFSMLGVPTRAEAAISIVEEPHWLNVLNQNPTSAGRPGRHQHTMVHGENVVTLANDRYRDPRAWRAIADVNGVDDPLRSRPGARVYLPAPDEMTRG